MKRLTLLSLTLLAAGLSPVSPTATASHAPQVVHSPNMSLEATFTDGGTYRQGTDLAFWGDTAILGSYDNPGGFRVLNLTTMTEVGQFACQGRQSDVIIWEDLVFVAVDTPNTGPECGAPRAGNQQVATGQAWEGVRVVSIADPANPEQLAAVHTNCGAHTITMVPDLERGRVLVYSLSYPLTGHHPANEQGNECGAHGVISVVEVPLADPASARVVSQPSVAPAVGCHDVTVLVPNELAAAACITESQIWDISDPVNPAILSHLDDDRINIHHSSTFSYDGKTVVIGDELGGAVATPGCTGGIAPVGALWFFDVSDPKEPEWKSFWRIPREVPSVFCTAHNFNVVPLKSGRDILVSAWYNGGTTVLDFTDPAAPEELGYLNVTSGDPDVPISATWSSYWYRDRIYANNFDEDVNSVTAKSRGLDVLRFDHPAVASAIDLPYLNPQTQEALPDGNGKLKKPKEPKKPKNSQNAQNRS